LDDLLEAGKRADRQLAKDALAVDGDLEGGGATSGAGHVRCRDLGQDQLAELAVARGVTSPTAVLDVDCY